MSPTNPTGWPRIDRTESQYIMVIHSVHPPASASQPCHNHTSSRRAMISLLQVSGCLPYTLHHLARWNRAEGTSCLF